MGVGNEGKACMTEAMVFKYGLGPCSTTCADQSKMLHACSTDQPKESEKSKLSQPKSGVPAMHGDQSKTRMCVPKENQKSKLSHPKNLGCMLNNQRRACVPKENQKSKLGLRALGCLPHDQRKIKIKQPTILVRFLRGKATALIQEFLLICISVCASLSPPGGAVWMLS